MYYEIKLKVNKIDEKTGEEKEVKEHYITDVELFSEAEQKGLYLYASENMECDVFAISRSSIIKILNKKEDGKPFFKATIVDTQIDDNGKEVKKKCYNLVCAKDVREANMLMEQHLSQGLNDMELAGIVKTDILEFV